jgi:hypothetical protein
MFRHRGKLHHVKSDCSYVIVSRTTFCLAINGRGMPLRNPGCCSSSSEGSNRGPHWYVSAAVAFVSSRSLSTGAASGGNAGGSALTIVGNVVPVNALKIGRIPTPSV